MSKGAPEQEVTEANTDGSSKQKSKSQETIVAPSGLARGLKGLSGLAAALGALLPGVAYFSQYAPPYFLGAAILVSGVAVVTLIWAFNAQVARTKIPGRAMLALAGSLLCLIGYSVSLRLTSVPIPSPRTGPRVQIGFGKAEWSLTPAGRKRLGEHPEDSTQRLLGAAGFNAEGANLVWKPWTIATAGVLSILLFLTGFVLWTYGFGLLAQLFAT